MTTVVVSKLHDQICKFIQFMLKYAMNALQLSKGNDKIQLQHVSLLVI